MAEGREQIIMDTFVELADTLASDYDIGEFLHLLVERCQEILAVDAGGVMLETAEGRLNLAAATSEKMERLDEAEMHHGEGPCIAAFRGVEQIIEEDLNATLEKWPNTTPVALELGLRAVYAFPLRLRGDCIGALNLYRERVGPFREADVRMAQAFADVAAIGILQHRQVTAAEARAEQLQGALNTRVVIEQAKGVLAAKSGLSPDEAFQAMRRHARSNRMNLHTLAKKVVRSQSADLDGL